MALKISSTETKPRMFVLTLSGSLDSTTHQEKFLSSMGVRVIFKAQKNLAGLNGKLLLVNMPPQIEKVFAIIDALPSLQVFSNMREMDTYLAKIQKIIKES